MWTWASSSLALAAFLDLGRGGRLGARWRWGRWQCRWRARCAWSRASAEGRSTLGTALAVLGASAHAAANARLLRRPVPGTPEPRVGVSVLIPARDEAATIGACLDALERAGLPRCSCSTTARPTPRPPLASARGARVLAGHTADTRLAGQAARLRPARRGGLG